MRGSPQRITLWATMPVGKRSMTITVDIKPEVQTELGRQAPAHGVAVKNVRSRADLTLNVRDYRRFDGLRVTHPAEVQQTR